MATIAANSDLKTPWATICRRLERQIPAKDFNTWIRPLQVRESANSLTLLAPNDFVVKKVTNNYVGDIKHCCEVLFPNRTIEVKICVGSIAPVAASGSPNVGGVVFAKSGAKSISNFSAPLNKSFTFDSFVRGPDNEMTYAAAWQVVHNLGKYNPLFIAGDVGLGKTHLMHAVGNALLVEDPNINIVYLHSERFVSEMIKALQNGKMEEFKQATRGADILLMDDVQFFIGKERSQQEIFHAINAMMDEGKQLIFTSDRFPTELDKLEKRLKSRLSWGLTVGIDPPDLETRVAILIKKAEQSQIKLARDVAFFIAEQIDSNVRELEGALKRVIANAHFTGKAINLEFARASLKDLLKVQTKHLTLDQIMAAVCKYYGLKNADLISKRRTRSITRPRQLAMHICKKLTKHSLPEIGAKFGGRDHTTVLHACRVIAKRLEDEVELKVDHDSIMEDIQ